MSATASARGAGTRTWLPFLLVIAVWALVVAQNITLPGVYMDAVNPDYLAVRLLHRHTEPIAAWLLPGNYLFGRAPVLISFYHGSQQAWLGLPGFFLFGTTVAGLRITHALFGLGVLAALYAVLGRAGLKPWQAGLACAALALDPSFTYAFRTQSYITVAPMAWLLLSLYCVQRAADAGTHRVRWLAGSGVLYGLAVVGYFIYAFFLPAILLALRWWTPPPARGGRGWVAWGAGAALGGAFYPVGYALVVQQMGGLGGAWSYFQQTQRALNAFSEQPALADRLAHVAATIASAFQNSFHHTLIFGEYGAVPGASFKMALLLAVPGLAWVRAEWRRAATPALRTFVALAVSFVAVAMLFGTRLSGHHYMVLVPVAYGALALGLASLATAPRAWQGATATFALPLAALVALNAGGQAKEAARLAETGGTGFYSDAINRLAADLDAAPRHPFVYFPDWGLSMPVAFLTGGRVGMDSLENFAAGRKMLCEGRDVAVAIVTGDRGERIAAWQRGFGWDAPATVVPYAQRDGKELFALATFTGRRDGPGCG
ncbi:MAG: hypothetical protein U1F58_19285 [Burkholderiales bacterium]